MPGESNSLPMVVELSLNGPRPRDPGLDDFDYFPVCKVALN